MNSAAQPSTEVPRIYAFDLPEAMAINLERQISAGRAADRKFAMLVPTATAMIAVLAALFRYAEPTAFALLIIQIAVAPLLAMFVITGASVFPRFRVTNSSNLFFGAIARQDPKDYVKNILELDRKTYLEDLARQCYVTATIAQKKHRLARMGYTCFLIALPLWAAAIYLQANKI